MRVAGYQMQVSREVASNRDRILDAIAEAARSGARVLLTPEGALSGYCSDFDQDEVATALDAVRGAARDAGIGLLLGTCFRERVDGALRCFNQVRVYDASGAYLGFHAKILRCSPLNDPGAWEMAEYDTVPLRAFEFDGATIGCLVCNDLWATPGCTTMPDPYLAWQLTRLGARAIFQVINSGSDQRYRARTEACVEIWARTLGIPILCVNATAGADAVNVRSGLVDAAGNRAVTVPDRGEHVFIAEMEIPAARMATAGKA